MAMTAREPGAYQRRQDWQYLLPLAPLLLFLAIGFVYPICQWLWLSVVDADGHLTIAHYAKLFSSTLYIRVLGITAKVALWTTALCLIAGYPVADFLATMAPGMRERLIIWILLPFWTSFLVRTFAWIVLLGRKGAVNELLVALGIADAPVDLIYNFVGVMTGMCHTLLPLAILTMLSVMQTIEAGLMHAAATMGARGGEAFWHVYFPLSMPGVAAAGLLIFITSLGFFIVPALLGGPRDMMIAQVIIFQLEELLNWSFAGAVSVMLLAAAIVVFYAYDRMLGLSTLSGQTATGARDDAGSANWLERLGGAIGRAFVAAMGRICAGFSAAWDVVWRRRMDRPTTTVSRMVLRTATGAIIIFLVVPSFFVIPVSFTTGEFIEWPPRGFTWRWYAEVAQSPIWQAAMIRSVLVGLATAVLAMLLGVPAAFVLVRRQVAGKTAIMSVILFPLMVPHIIIGVGLFYLYARVGLVGTSVGLVLGHTVLAVLFVVVTVMAVLKNYDERLDQAAWSLGASKLKAFRLVTLPIISAGMIAGFLFAFVKSLDELAVALFVTGGLVTTLPKQMWADALLKVNPTLTAVSTIMLIVITAAILLAEHLVRRRT